jgi:hypothetical protein
MQITIIDVGTPNTHAAKNGSNYQSIEVTYKGADGRVANKKLMSFANPEVFKLSSSWNKGDEINIVSEKDGAGYWQWLSVGEPGQAAPVATAGKPATTGARVTGSNYETTEERAARQVLIVRQSSLSSAINILSVGAKSLDPAYVIDLAVELADWVYQKKVEMPGGFDNMEDDIPL